MVLTVIAVYVVCWLPYWLFQIITLYITGVASWFHHLVWSPEFQAQVRMMKRYRHLMRAHRRAPCHEYLC